MVWSLAREADFYAVARQRLHGEARQLALEQALRAGVGKLVPRNVPRFRAGCP